MSSASDKTIGFSCHCGAIRVAVPREPAPVYINECMCSTCRRYGAAWIYYPVNTVQIEKDGPTKMYCWGDKTCEFTWCEHCGCLVYWYPVGADAATSTTEIGVNSRCVDHLEELKHVERRITWRDALATREGVYDEHGPCGSSKISTK